jgi:hypothetical protein
MDIPAIIRTSFGPRSLPHRPLVRVSLTPTELYTLVHAIERDAIKAEEEGRISAADCLSWRAASLREAAR